MSFFAMRAHNFIANFHLASNMRPINVTFDSVTWELAKRKINFSAWVRDQLRSERNRTEHRHPPLSEISSERLQYELQRRGEEE